MKAHTIMGASWPGRFGPPLPHSTAHHKAKSFVMIDFQRTSSSCFSAVITLALFLLGGAAALPAVAQPTWTEGTVGGPQVSLDWTKPSPESGGELAGEVGTSLLTSRLLLSGQYPISAHARLVADLPISRFGIDDEDAGEADGVSSTKIGNPYLGAHARFGDGLAAGGGVRLPLASTPDDLDVQSIVDALALQAGSISDLGRVEAFGPETFTARGYGEYTARSDAGLAGRLRTGLSLLVPTEDTDTQENVVLFDYGGRAWYDGDPLRVGVGLGGRTNLNADEEESFGERSIYFLGAALQAQFDRVRPGLTLRMPLSEEPSEVLDYALGVSLTVTL